jgi:hypothetical protein
MEKTAVETELVMMVMMMDFSWDWQYCPGPPTRGNPI